MSRLSDALASIARLVESRMLVNPTTKSRTRSAIRAKATYYFLLRDMGFSLNEMGLLLGINHTSIMHHVNDEEKRLDLEDDIKALTPRARKAMRLYKDGVK